MAPLDWVLASRSTCNSQERLSSRDLHLRFKADALSASALFLELRFYPVTAYCPKSECKSGGRWIRLDTWAGNAMYYFHDCTGRNPPLQLRPIRCIIVCG